MPVKNRLLSIGNDLPAHETSEALPPALDVVRVQAAERASTLVTLSSQRWSDTFSRRHRRLARSVSSVLRMIETPAAGATDSNEFRWLRDNVKVLTAVLAETRELPQLLENLPWVRTGNSDYLPRVIAIAEDMFFTLDGQFHEGAFTVYVDSFQETTLLEMDELWVLLTALKFVFLEEIASRAARLKSDLPGNYGISTCVRSLREIGATDWEDVIEPLILFDHVLQEDPAGAYSHMDSESRERYRRAVVMIADGSSRSEMDVAIEALSLAREAQQQANYDPRMILRRSHIGYYLVAEGVEELRRRAGYAPRLKERALGWLQKRASAFYVSATHVLTMALLGSALLLASGSASWTGLMFAAMVLFLPCSQAAVELLNFIVTCLVPPQILSKLDFSEGISSDCVTLVAVPSLLLNEQQVRDLVSNLEIRYLGNHDPNLHFALLTDLPDSVEPSNEEDPLVDLCAELVGELNDKYADRGAGSFVLLHRHRVYNAQEKVWMGWERKRGKLLDLNQLLRGEYDSFPVKVGDLSVLRSVRFVIALDADTDLPNGAAKRLVGALAHPLQQAIVDPERNIVVAGYGILQPGVDVTPCSATRSRFASIYSGQSGLDLYTRAVSDVYQDLFGEGIFTGKGIYEVETFHRVLNHRLPYNRLLSHDLIEGVYVRAGLASDIRLADDYPSHYDAYSRRKHRWLRGDWQIAEWLMPRVPHESGSRVRNPLSFISRWKILDNLRRSLVEPSTFLLLVLGWFVLPGNPYLWTLAVIGVLLAPACLPFGLHFSRSIWRRKPVEALQSLRGLAAALRNLVLALTFALHQTMLSLDAVARTLVRRWVTEGRLLEWETAAEAESRTRGRTCLNVYLDRSPMIAVGIAIGLWLVNPGALPPAVPILLLWCFAKPVSLFLSRPARTATCEVTSGGKLFLRGIALRTWRFFATFSNEEHHWLVPDTIQKPAGITAMVSPTNIGLLLNARQAACEFGYITVPEFAAQTLRTLQTTRRLERYRGHLFNWYSTQDLRPLPPYFVSTVDSGNLVASLWTLQQGSLEQLRRPVLPSALANGLQDCLALASEAGSLPAELFELKNKLAEEDWLEAILSLPAQELHETDQVSTVGIFNDTDATDATDVKDAKDVKDPWFQEQAILRVREVRQLVRHYMPWLLPQFSSLLQALAMDVDVAREAMPPLERLPRFIQALIARLTAKRMGVDLSDRFLLQQLLDLLVQSEGHATRLIDDLQAIARHAESMAEETDFEFLLDRRHRVFSIGFDAGSQQLHPYCYDLLASESRMATFAAIAKGDIPQETWFFLRRSQIQQQRQAVLLSWSGTMFEYFMPALWMRTYPNTLLHRSLAAAVRVQRAYASRKRVPWGISESAYARKDENGNFKYFAFGVPSLALHAGEREGLVISPYATVLALTADASRALENLGEMSRRGWLGEFGFYESVDFSEKYSRRHGKIITAWMAHHQGMSLLAIANCVHEGVVQRWFHGNGAVQATEMLLHDRPVAQHKENQQETAAA